MERSECTDLFSSMSSRVERKARITRSCKSLSYFLEAFLKLAWGQGRETSWGGFLRVITGVIRGVVVVKVIRGYQRIATKGH